MPFSSPPPLAAKQVLEGMVKGSAGGRGSEVSSLIIEGGGTGMFYCLFFSRPGSE